MDTTSPEPPRWLTTVDLAERYQVPIETIRWWRKVGRGPRAHKLGGLVRYALADVEQWEAEHAEEVAR